MAKSVKKGSKEYAFITVDENYALQLKNETLIQRVWNSSIFIENAEDAAKKRYEEQRIRDEWQTYLSCDPFPKPFEPTKIRKFFFKASQYEEKDIENTVNWVLSIVERSVLSQDIDAPNLTKRHLRLSKPNFGGQYDTRVNEAMVIARSIEDFLEYPTVELSPRIMKDVEEMKFLAYSQIYQYIENLTYRVLCSENAYMDPIDVTTAEYAYQGKLFDIHIWTFRNVPIYLDPFDTPSKTVDLYKIKTKLVIPFSVLCENMIIRGLHCQFDHFSAHARYYDLPQAEEVEESLRICLQNEWDTQMRIQAEVKAKLMNQRAEFEEAQRLKAEEEEKAKTRVKKDDDKPKPKKKEKPKKPQKEPPILTPDIVPVIRKDFLNYDFLEYEETMVQFHPDRFGLTRGEINLRQYQILGGVYQITTLFKPKVVHLPKIVMSWYKSERIAEHLDIQTQFVDTTKSRADVVKFFQITFELPEHFCLWGKPIPCLFEEGESYRVANLPDTNIESESTLKKVSPVIINDFNLHDLFTRSLMHDFVEATIPHIVSSFKFPDDFADEETTKKAKATLMHSKHTEEEHEHEQELLMQKHLYSYDAQNNPERLFPLFKKALPVVILPMQDERTHRLHPYENFSEFMSALLSIEASYRMSKFKDRHGEPIKILAENYERNVRRPQARMSKTIVYTQSRAKLSKLSMSASSIAAGLNSLRTGSTLEGKSSSTSQPTEKELGMKHSKHKHQKHVIKEVAQEVEEEVIEQEFETGYSKWSTANILKSEFNAATRKVTIWTDRLGTFGFAFYRYQHFPFQNWSLQPNEENPNEVELKIESKYAVFRLYISANGYRVSITDFTKYFKSRKVYLEIKEPIRDIKILKEKLQQKHLNIFPERDAVWYMTEYFSEKHLSAELHTYDCISLYATSLKFLHSIWNKLSNRRNMVLKFGELRDLEEDLFVLCIHPEDVTFVEIKELCTADLDNIELAYKPTWRNFEWYPDLNHLITSTYVHWSEMRTKEPNLVYYLKCLLQAIRPLSCS